MDTNEIKKLNDEELGVETSRMRRAIFDLKSQVVTEKVKDSSQFSKLRADLARVLTEVSARRVAATPSSKQRGTRAARLAISQKSAAPAPVVRKKVKS